MVCHHPPHPQEKLSKMKANEAKLESDKRRLKEVLDASESRGVKLELQRRALEGELRRSQLGLSGRETQAQALQERAGSLQKQVGPRAPGSRLGLSGGRCRRRPCRSWRARCRGRWAPALPAAAWA